MIYILIALIAVGLGYWFGRKSKIEAQQALDQNIIQQNQLLNEQIKEKTQQLESLTATLLQTKADIVKESAIDKEHFEELTNKFKEQKFEEYKEQALKYKEQLVSNAESRVLEQTIEVSQLYQKLYDLQDEIENLTQSRNALIEAQKREEELKLQTEFYKIQISDKSIKDIEIIQSIEKHLNNPEPLYKLIWSVFYQKPVKEMLGRVIGPEKTCGIYKITNLTNQKIYIGQSVDVANRLTDHIKASLGIGTISHQKIHDIMFETGLQNFSFELVEKCDRSELNTKEKLWIKTYQADSYGYNQTAGGS